MTFRIVTGALVALLAALLLRWLLTTGEPAPAPPELDTRFDYVLQNFTARFSDATGQPGLEVSGPRLEHDPRTRDAIIDQPVFSFGPQDDAWHGNAELARIDRQRDRLVLERNVQLYSEQPDRPRTDIRGERFLLDHQERTITSDDPVTMQQPGTELRAGGLKVSLDQETVRMSNHVEGHFSLDARAADRSP